MPFKTAIIAASEYRQSIFNKKIVCTLVDFFLTKSSKHFFNFRFGDLKNKELFKSTKIELRFHWNDVFRALLFWTPDDFFDAKALWSLQSKFYDSPYKPQRWFPILGYCRLPRLLWFFYSFFGIKILNGRAYEFAKNFECLWIVCFYDTRSLAFVSAFRKQGKPVVDIQHGLIGSTHPAYSNRIFWKTESSFQPSSFIVWNEFTKNFLEKETKRKAKIRPFDDRVYLKTKISSLHPQNTVLITLSWGLDNILPAEIRGYILRRPRLRFIIRPHPRDKQPLLGLLKSGVLSKCKNAQIVSHTTPLIDCLRKSKLHITGNSSVVIESAQIGIRSFFWDKLISRSFQREIDCGMARFVPLSRLPKEIDSFFNK